GIHTLRGLAKRRARYPQPRVDWLLTANITELIQHHPAVSNVLVFARQDFTRFGRSWAATAGLARLVSAIWRARYDLVIDLHGQFRSALFTLASGSATR